MINYKFVNQGGINWAWLLCYEEVEGGVRIVFHERWHRFEGGDPAWVTYCFEQAQKQGICCDVLETTERVANELQFHDYDVVMDRGTRMLTNRRLRRVPIVNKKYIFHYRDFAEVMAWHQEIVKGEQYV